MRRALLIVALAIGLASPAAAQSLKLSFQNGLVTIDASNVPVRTILTEWGKQGGTKIVGAERLAGAPLTLKLVNVTEAKALESILRTAPGYVAAPRGMASAATGPSMYDRILVMATTSAPAPAVANRPAPGANNAAFNGTQRFVPPRQQQQQQQEADNQQDDPDDNPPNPPVFTFPPQPQGNFNPQQFNGAPPQLNGGPVTMQINPQTGTAQTITINPSQPASQPAMPAGASTPGVIVAPPQPQQQVPPGTMIRPPGRQQQ